MSVDCARSGGSPSHFSVAAAVVRSGRNTAFAIVVALVMMAGLSAALLLLLSSCEAYVATTGVARSSARVSRAGKVSAALGVRHLLRDLEFLGPCRFVVAGRGAILEAIGVFEGMREGKPGLATVSNDDNTFECHIKLNEIRGAQFATKEAASGKTLHIVRLLGDDGASLLSAILHPDDGDEVDEGAIQFYDSLRKKFGDNVELVAEQEGEAD